LDERLAHIRANEKMSHVAIYTNEKLYQSNTWLRKPIKTVQDICPLFNGYDKLQVLDLGCGIGRNCIYIAEKYKNINCTVECVDLLEVAIEKLRQNAKEHNVSSHIIGIVKSIEEYDISVNAFDFIMAISALEHIDTEQSFIKKLFEIKNGLRKDGIVCLVINSDIKEINLDTQENLDAQFEVNLSTEKIQEYLNDIFSGWNILKYSVSKQEYDIPRDSIISHLYTKVVTYVARKCK
jgi:2-polyprenyl-3-methyl-5-hydroxy-6-metoxy-1,4-benzoquinol methylase